MFGWTVRLSKNKRCRRMSCLKQEALQSLGFSGENCALFYASCFVLCCEGWKCSKLELRQTMGSGARTPCLLLVVVQFVLSDSHMCTCAAACWMRWTTAPGDASSAPCFLIVALIKINLMDQGSGGSCEGGIPSLFRHPEAKGGFRVMRRPRL